MSKTTNKFSQEVRERAPRMVLDHRQDYPSRWAAVVSISQKIGCSPPTLHEWVKRTEVDSGARAGGGHSKPSNMPHWNGSTGSTINGCWNPSAISRPWKLRKATTPCWTKPTWPLNLNQMASGNPGAVQFAIIS
tara:strand:- start:2133 stop:2534 length:402 start_codon:yes stop_codon:yes gene_type:complete